MVDTFSFMWFRISVSLASSVDLSDFALTISFLRRRCWNSSTERSSKQPLFGILDFRNLGLIRDFKQDSKKSMRRLLFAIFLKIERYLRNTFQQPVRCISSLNKCFGKNIVAQELLRRLNNQQWVLFYFLTIYFDLIKIIIRSKIQ